METVPSDPADANVLYLLRHPQQVSDIARIGDSAWGNYSHGVEGKGVHGPDMINVVENLIDSEQVTRGNHVSSTIPLMPSLTLSIVVCNAVEVISNAAPSSTVTSIEALLANIEDRTGVAAGFIFNLNTITDVFYGVTKAVGLLPSPTSL